MPDTHDRRRDGLTAGAEGAFSIRLLLRNYGAPPSVFLTDTGSDPGQGFDHGLGQPVPRLLQGRRSPPRSDATTTTYRIVGATYLS